MKKFLNFVLCCSLLFALAISASAANERLLEYQHIDTVTANITANQFWGYVTCTGSVAASGDYDTTVIVYLQQKNGDVWDTLTSWRDSGRIASDAGGNYAVARGNEYRTYTVGYVYDENGTIIDSAYATYSVYLS